MTKKVAISNFSGGIVNDPRTPSSNSARMVSNFDILTDPFRMIPYRASEVGNVNQATDKIQNYCLARRTETGASATYSLYGLGISGTGTNRAKIFYKNLTNNGSVTALDNDDWDSTTTTNNVSSNDNSVFDLFVYYQRTGLIYGARANVIWAYDPTGTAAFSETVTGSFNYTYIGQGVVHPQTDVLYIPYYYDGAGVAADIVSAIASKNGTDDINPTAFSLPKHLRARSICPFGNYLAIACETLDPAFGGNSVVIIWDLGSTKASETIDWGSERLFIIEEINGSLIGISVSSIHSERAFVDGRIVFRYLSVSSAIKFAEFTAKITTALAPGLAVFKQKINNRLYFLMKFAFGNSDLLTASPLRHGVWSVGGRPGNWTFTNERTTDNNTTFVSANLNLLAFHYVGDFLFISYTDSGTHKMSKSFASSTYTATSIWESTINPNMSLQDRIRKKQIMAVAVHYEPLPSGGQVVLKYRVDAATAWASATTIFTETTDNAVITEKNTPFTEGREYEFRIESTGGAVITGFDYSYILKETQL